MTPSGLIITRQSGHIRQATGHLPRGLVFGWRLRLWESGALEVQMSVMKCWSAKQGDSTDFHSFGSGRVPAKKHWVVVLDEGTYVLPGGVAALPKWQGRGRRSASSLSRPLFDWLGSQWPWEIPLSLGGGSYQWVFGGVLKVGYP